MKPYKTIFSFAEVEEIIQKSKFIGYAFPVDNEEEANENIERIRKKHYNATHNVPVYLLKADMSIQRYSDDGEPSGTAGISILEMLKKEEITNICVVVTRYFGGIKLGTGGLVRAYTDVAKKAILASRIVEKSVFSRANAKIDYHMYGKVQNFLIQCEDIVQGEASFTDHVMLEFYIRYGKEDYIIGELVEISAGKIEIEIKEAMYITMENGAVIV